MKKRFAFVLFCVILIAMFFVPTQDITKVNVHATLETASKAHWFGTDNLGRDVFSLMVVGCFRSLIVVLIATILSCAVGTVLGLLAGYYEGWLERGIRFFADIFLIFPSFILALIIAALFGLTPISAGIVFGLGNMGEYIHQSCALTKSVKYHDYIQLDKVLGISNIAIIFNHILPNILASTLSFMANKASSVIIQYASLSFIGLGTDVTNPDWGTMLYQYRIFALDHPRLILYPMAGIFLLAFLFHVMFEGEGRQEGDTIYDS